MILYHRTNRESARQIEAHGFRDKSGYYLTETIHSGVWLSDVPLDANDGVGGDVLLEVTVELASSEIAEYEWVEEGRSFREFLIPAAILNPVMQLRIVEGDE